MFLIMPDDYFYWLTRLSFPVSKNIGGLRISGFEGGSVGKRE